MIVSGGMAGNPKSDPDGNCRLQPFPPTPDLLAVSDEVVKLSAVCMQCGAPAIHTQRLGSNQSLVLVGAAGLYEARCRSCFRPYVDDEAEQLELPTGAE